MKAGRPGRARILYICREIDNEPLSEFLTHDTKAFVKLIKLFNRVHELKPGLTDEQLKAIFHKTESRNCLSHCLHCITNISILPTLISSKRAGKNCWANLPMTAANYLTWIFTGR